MSCDTCKSHSPPAGAHFCSWQSAIDPSRRLQFRSLPRAVSSVTFSGGVGCRVGWETEGFCVTSPSTGTASSMRFLQSPRVGGENRQISFFCAAPGWRFRSRAISGIGNTSHPPRHPPTHPRTPWFPLPTPKLFVLKSVRGFPLSREQIGKIDK